MSVPKRFNRPPLQYLDTDYKRDLIVAIAKRAQVSQTEVIRRMVDEAALSAWWDSLGGGVLPSQTVVN